VRPRPLPSEELRAGTAHSALYLRRLRRRQLGLSLLALVTLAGVVGSLPLVLYLAGDALAHSVLGVPLAAFVVAVPPFAFFVALGWLYARRADGVDADFQDLVDRP